MRNKKKAIIITTLIVLALIIGLVLLYQYVSRHYHFEYTHIVEDIQNYINSYGSFSAAIYIIIFVLKTFFVINPYSALVVLGGSLFGSIYGFIYSEIGIIASSTLAFFISRAIGKNKLEKLLKNKMEKLKLNFKIEDKGFYVIFTMRISMLFPFDLLSYAAGVSGVKYSHFILGTILGSLPETISLTLLGENLKHPRSIGFILSIILLVIILVIPVVYKKIKNRKAK